MKQETKVAVRHIDYVYGPYLMASIISDPIGAMQWVYDRYGPLVAAEFELPFGRKPQRFLLAVGARFNEPILSDPVTFHSSGPMLPGPQGSAQRRIRAGLVSMNGVPHEHYRRLLLPPFRRTAVDYMVGRIRETVDSWIQDWPMGRVVDLWPLVKDVSQHVAITSLFGADESSNFAEPLAAAELINEHLHMAGSGQVRVCPINLRGLPYRKMLHHAERVESTLTAWAKKRRGKLQSNDLLSLIVNSPNEFGNLPDDVQASAHLLTIFGASYETCQTALIWALFLLAQHPDTAAALLDELSMLPADGSLSADGLEKCWLLDAVIKESMRLLPTVPFQVRKAVCDTKLGDCEIKNKTRVILSPFLTNRLSAIYPDGDCFKPERWSGIQPSQFEYLAFSAGPRTCIGYWFALTFLKIAIAQILRRYRWTLVPGVRIDRQISVTMSPSRGVPVTIHAQDRRFQASPIVGNIRQLVRL
jgi:cytochrome P450